MDFLELQKKVYEEYIKNGFQDKFNEKGAIGDIAELGLITTEIGEAIESIRDDNREELCFELADIVIRVMNICNRKGIDLGTWILKKNDLNLSRDKFHGRKII